MKRLVLITIQLASILALVLYLNYKWKKSEKKSLNVNFSSQIIHALNLRLVNSDSIYLSYGTRIFNDTIVGYYYSKRTTHQPEKELYYFEQDLKNLNKKVIVPNKSITPLSIDVLKDGCLYFGEFGRSNMQRICRDGSVEEFFKGNHVIFYANKVLLYKDKTIIISMNGIFIYDTKRQLLLWKYHFIKNVDLAPGSVIGHKFIFSELFEQGIGKTYTSVHCVDLDKLKFSWHKNFKGVYVEQGIPTRDYRERDAIQYDKKNIFIRISGTMYLSGLEDGEINYSNNSIKRIESDDIHFFAGSTNNSIICLNNNYKSLWEIKNANLIGIHGSYIIAITPNRLWYLIIDKNSGEVEKRILNPNTSDRNLELFDEYIMLNGMSLYK